MCVCVCVCVYGRACPNYCTMHYKHGIILYLARVKYLTINLVTIIMTFTSICVLVYLGLLGFVVIHTRIIIQKCIELHVFAISGSTTT